jgi:hypothetical protein
MPVRRIHYGCIPMGNDLVFFDCAWNATSGAGRHRSFNALRPPQLAASFILGCASLIPRQLPPSPMRVLPVRVEHALNVPVQRPPHADPRHDLQCIIRQWALQRLGLITRRAHPHVLLLVGRQDHRHGLGMAPLRALEAHLRSSCSRIATPRVEV